ncbi:hypothetical protein WJX72_001033 [[Myrmecia] bisecta]|uniref:UspA domain-containing protein n=1 Tax=[Myrmecia] bisecta TaxID=41462 RepID=A0AAW1Q843_9CHLO
MQLESTWVARQRGEKQSTCEALTELAHERHVGVLVVGSYGRKGEKIDMLGTVSDHSLREYNGHVCIVKSTSFSPSDSTRWLFATDNSLAAQTAFAVLMYQFCKPEDIVDVVYATSGDEPAGIMKPYEQLLKERKVRGRCSCIKVPPGETISSAILNEGKRTEVDVLVVGICGYGKQKLGSVSEECCRTSTCTTLVVKDPYEVQEKRGLLGAYQ